MKTLLIHGTGRFGQNLLHTWLKNPSLLDLQYIIDNMLSVEDLCSLLKNHDRIDFSHAAPEVINGNLLLTTIDGGRKSISFYKGDAVESSFVGKPDFWLECSGLYTDADACRQFVKDNTSNVLISATSLNADKTLIFGYNHQKFKSEHQIISYGSCTVNAFVPLADWVQKAYGIDEADVNIIHNLPGHKFSFSNHPYRNKCTLEIMAPKLFSWLKPDNFNVAYTLIPYAGASFIDFRFRIKNVPSLQIFLEQFKIACAGGTLKHLYCLDEIDSGIASAVGQNENVIFPNEGISLKNNILRMNGYFDNENSAVRYYDLVSYIAG